MIRKICIVFNPISGKGKSSVQAELLKRELASAGCTVNLQPSAKSYAEGVLESLLNDIELLVIVGGDGTLLPFLSLASDLKVPVYMYPTGNQSLFARHFGMKRDLSRLILAIKKPKIEPHQYATLNDHNFFCMASVGLDAEIVKEVSKDRVAPVGNLGYVLPTLRSLLKSKPPTLSIEHDGQLLLEKVKGYLIIANTPQYALDLNLLRAASSQQAKIEAMFLAVSSSAELILMFAKALVGIDLSKSSKCFRFSEQSYKVWSEQDNTAVQADGDFLGELPIEIKRADNPLLVLLPQNFSK